MQPHVKEYNMENTGRNKVDHYLVKYGNLVFMMVDTIRQGHIGILNLCSQHKPDCINCPVCDACKLTKTTEETEEEYKARWQIAMCEAYNTYVGDHNE